MNFEGLTPDQQIKARACSTPEELLALAKAEGYELSDAELDGIAGGKWARTRMPTAHTTATAMGRCSNTL